MDSLIDWLIIIGAVVFFGRFGFIVWFLNHRDNK